MSTFTRVFLIVITFTVTNKLDKERQPNAAESKWTANMWPFWIYIAIYIILSLTAFIVFVICLIKYCSVLIGGSSSTI